MKLSRGCVLLALVMAAAIFAVAAASQDAAPKMGPPRHAGQPKQRDGRPGARPPMHRNRRALLGANGGNYGPASYMSGYGPNWGYGGYGYVPRSYAMLRFPTIPDQGRMETSNDRRFAMISH